MSEGVGVELGTRGGVKDLLLNTDDYKRKRNREEEGACDMSFPRCCLLEQSESSPWS